MKHTITYTPKGVCCQEMHIEIEDNHVVYASFQGGCSGNLLGIAALIKGMPVSEVIEKLGNIRCGSKKTSCPAQLALALAQPLSEEISEVN